MYPIVQVYGSLALEDNSEADEAELRLRTSQPKKCSPQLAFGSSEREFGHFPQLWGAKGPGMRVRYQRPGRYPRYVTVYSIDKWSDYIFPRITFLIQSLYVN